MAKLKFCLKLLSLRLGHTAVESAEGKAVLTKRFCSKGDECYPVQVLPPVLTLGRTLQPDGYAPQRRIYAPLREHRHIPRRQLLDHRDGMIGLLWQFHQIGKLGSVEKQNTVFDDRTEGYDKAVGPLLARHRRDIQCHQSERAPELCRLLFPIGDEPLRFTPLARGLRRTIVLTQSAAEGPMVRRLAAGGKEIRT